MDKVSAIAHLRKMPQRGAPKTCRTCGQTVYFSKVNLPENVMPKWAIFNPDWTMHRCQRVWRYQ